jgi:hypothetical protein
VKSQWLIKEKDQKEHGRNQEKHAGNQVARHPARGGDKLV